MEAMVQVDHRNSAMTQPEPPTRVLIVDDDLSLRALLKRYLGEQGITADEAGNGAQLDTALQRRAYDLIVLDLMLPGEDGFAICRRLRERGEETPILMLTARGDDVDRIVGLEIGADDYLPKPGNPRELLARIRAILRRTPRPVPGTPGKPGERLRFGPFELDFGARRLVRNGEDLRLTGGEIDVLIALARRPREPLSRDRLLSDARGREADVFNRAVDVAISRLRRALEDDPANPRYIQTLRGRGYVFIPGEGT
jgi:DNA-binding response OmpR family regulator